MNERIRHTSGYGATAPRLESDVASKAPGDSHRKGISLIDLAEMFPSEEAAVKWFEAVAWPTERCCGHCGSIRTTDASHAKMPYWCSDCRSYFSVRTGTLMERSKVPIRKWVYAIYLDVTSLKGVAAMKLHRDIGVSYKTAWFMQQRIREAFAAEGTVAMSGPVEVDEAHFGGKRRNMSNAKRAELAGTAPLHGKTGGGPTIRPSLTALANTFGVRSTRTA